jgi:hypothetical protein
MNIRTKIIHDDTRNDVGNDTMMMLDMMLVMMLAMIFHDIKENSKLFM